MKNMLRPLALATQLGMTMGVMTVSTVLIGLFLGSWLDRQLGTRPAATLLFILLGVLAGSLGTINLAQATLRQLNAAAADNTQPRTPFSTRDLGRAIGLVLELSLATLVPVGLGLALGLWLDRTLGTRPAFTISVSAVCVIVALLATYLIVMRTTQRTDHDS